LEGVIKHSVRGEKNLQIQLISIPSKHVSLLLCVLRHTFIP